MSRELTRQEKVAIRKLVTKWCANYDKDYMPDLERQLLITARVS